MLVRPLGPRETPRNTSKDRPRRYWGLFGASVLETLVGVISRLMETYKIIKMGSRKLPPLVIFGGCSQIISPGCKQCPPTATQAGP